MTSESLLPLSASLSKAGAGVTVNRDRSCCHFLGTTETHKAKNSISDNKVLGQNGSVSACFSNIITMNSFVVISLRVISTGQSW